MKFLNWKDDKWKSEQGSIIKYDKLEHFLLALIGLLATALILGFSLKVIGTWLAIAILYEVKDGIFTYDGVHIQGFSYKDLIAGIFGFVAAMVVYLMMMRFGLL